MARIAIVLLALTASACARQALQVAPGVPALSCNAPLQPYLRADLYMDRATRTEAEWTRFVDEVLVKYLPAGGTVLPNSGWWRRPDGTTFHGLGRTLVLLAPARDAAAHRVAVQAVIAEFKKRYGSQSVGWEEDWVCATF